MSTHVNIQNEPFVDVTNTLGAVLKAQFPVIKHAIIGWPESKWLQVDRNLPAIYFVDITEHGEYATSQLETHRTIRNDDGTGFIVKEKQRLHTLMQITLFSHTKAERDALGWGIKQYLIRNFRMELIDYLKPTPMPTGEYMMLKYAGDHKEEKGEANFWQRDLTFLVQTRVLDAEVAYPVKKVDDTVQVQTQMFDISTHTVTKEGE